MSDLPILPTTVVGSHGKPGWWHVCKDLHAQGDWGPYDLEELLSDAVDIAILDQERAGVDIITDGEARHPNFPEPAQGCPQFSHLKNGFAVLLDFDPLGPDGDVIFLVADQVCSILRQGYVNIGISPLHRSMDTLRPQTYDMQIALALQRFKANR